VSHLVSPSPAASGVPDATGPDASVPDAGGPDPSGPDAGVPDATGPDPSGPWARSNATWFERARRVIPGGVSSPVRAFRAVGGVPYTVVRGSGSRLEDVEGRQYLDFVQSWGALILGHAHPAVVEAVQRAMEHGSSFGAPTTYEVLLAEEVCSRVSGCEQVRFVSSGTEAAMSAIRIARGYTGRDRLVKFSGCYHGHSDGLLAAGGSGVATLGLAGSAGVPAGMVADTVVAPYNVVPEITGDVACVIVEPLAANMGFVAPRQGFLDGLREACDRAGALLIFDEVITGFRLAYGGATEHFGVRPDIWCFGKVLGGGLPLAAFGGSREVLSVLAPEGPVYQAGTLSGNPVALAAGLATLSQMDRSAYDIVSKKVADFAQALGAVFAEAGIPVQVPAAGALLGISFAEHPLIDYEDARLQAEGGRYASFFHAMLGEGIAFAPSAFEVAFPSMAHKDSDYEQVLQAASRFCANVM